jgi:hypothetical protein
MSSSGNNSVLGETHHVDEHVPCVLGVDSLASHSVQTQSVCTSQIKTNFERKKPYLTSNFVRSNRAVANHDYQSVKAASDHFKSKRGATVPSRDKRSAVSCLSFWFFSLESLSPKCNSSGSTVRDKEVRQLSRVYRVSGGALLRFVSVSMTLTRRH